MSGSGGAGAARDGEAVDLSSLGPTPDRAAVRALAESVTAEIRRASAAGENVHQRILDLQDRVGAFAATLAPDAAEAFNRTYLEELNALTAATWDHADDLERRAGELRGETVALQEAVASDAATGRRLGIVIVVLIAVGLLYVLLH